MKFIEKMNLKYDFAEVVIETYETRIPYIDIYKKMEYNGKQKRGERRMITKGEIKREAFLNKSLTKRFLAQLQQLPEGRLYMKKERGYQRAYQRVGGKERYLNQRKTKIAIGLANRREVERAIKQLEENMELLEYGLQT